MKRLWILLVVAVLAAGCGGSAVTLRVDTVESGDLVVLRSGERLRLAGIEAPPEGAEGFEESRAFLLRLVGDKKLRITRIGEDADGSIIAEIYIDNISISKIMKILNVAKPKTRRPVSRRR